MKRLFAFVLLTAATPGLAIADGPATWGSLESGDHRIGFEMIEETDNSRAVRPDSTSVRSWPRPIRVYLWYPARTPAQAEPMSFARYADLADHDVWPEAMLGSARERTAYDNRPLARSLGSERFNELRTQRVAAFENAPAADGSYPLIVVAQGLYYESPITHAAFCEYLASHGFVVASAPLVGTNSPLVNLDVIDLETQVRDLEFVIARVRNLPFVDPDALGAFGFDMGGMSALILAMRNPDVDVLVSTDSAILFGHPAGIPEDSAHHDSSLLRIPWFHATQRRFGTLPEHHEGPNLLAEAVHSDRYLLLVDEVGHWDFTSYAMIENRGPIMGYWPPRQGGEKQRYEVVCRYIRDFFAGFLGHESEARTVFARDPEDIAPGMGLSLEHREPVPPLPTYSDFLNALITGEVEEARSIAQSIRETDPDGPLLRETTLNRLGYHLIASWQLYDAAITVFALNIELHPESVNTYDSMGDAYVWKGEDATAIAWFKKVLEIDPDNERAQAMIERLENRKNRDGD